MVDRPDPEKLPLDGKFQKCVVGEALGVQEEAVEVVLCLVEDAFDVFLLLFGGIFEGGTDGSGDHGFEFGLLLYFIAVISD